MKDSPNSFIRVSPLAGWGLGAGLRRLIPDWEAKYGHPIVWAETFVDRSRFAGTCYRAAHWVRQGATTGRSHQDRYTTLKVPVKDLSLYPLRTDFRDFLYV
jgi:hypothetical protein